MVIGQVQLVVGNPRPVVFHVDARLPRNVEEQESALAVDVSVGGDVRPTGTCVALQLCAITAANPPVDVPHADGSRVCLGHVPFYHDCSGIWADCLKYEIGQLDAAGISRRAHTEDRLWVVLIGESRSHDHGPDFAGDVQLTWHLDRIGNLVGSMIKVGYLLRRSCLVKKALYTYRIIGHLNS